MSWYVGVDGKQVWVESNELVYTVDEPAEELPVVTLTYLTTGDAKQAVYAEHMIDEETGAKNNKAKDKQSGRQRGFVVRLDRDEGGAQNVVSAFKATAEKLIATGVVKRVDIDNSEARAEKKKRSRRKNKDTGPVGAAVEAKDEEEEEKKEEEIIAAPVLPLGVNECRVDTTARCQHNAHGTGFRVEIMSDDGPQRIHFFTMNKDLATSDWYRSLVEAVNATGSRVMLGRLANTEVAPGSSVAGGPPPKTEADKAGDDEDDWLGAMMGLKIKKPEVENQKPRSANTAAENTCTDDSAEAATAEGLDDGDSAPKAKKEVPPWLRRRGR